MITTIFIAAALAVTGIGFGFGFHDAARLIGFLLGLTVISGVLKGIFGGDK